ncbi:MAG: glycosyltransferase family 4 protein, partial [Deltaproteobacteria bacterium]|nr:glycosyltransferase family 4 protein [Deltaproteobacteria bacterium]
HEIVMICRDYEPEQYPFVARAVAYDAQGNPTELFTQETKTAGKVTLHQLPRTSIYPVYIQDKQRDGHVKSFPEMSAEELKEYHDAMVATVKRVLKDDRPDILHANHLVYQPIVAAEACKEAGVPFYVVPHGSSIEYTVNEDDRFKAAARKGLEAAQGVAWIAREVRDRVYKLFPDLKEQVVAKSQMVGVGTDTSLFAPVAKSERRASLDTLKALHVPGGKTAALRDELKRRLDEGDVEATRAYWDAYNHKLADDDLPTILDDIPVEEDLLFFVGAMTYGKGIQSLLAAMPGILARHPKTHLVLVGSVTYREVLEAIIHALATGNEPLFDSLAAKGKDLERSSATGGLEDLQAYAKDPAHRKVLFGAGPALAKHIHILGRLDHPKLRRVFPCCEIGVFPSVIKEASPLVFAESLANSVLPTGSYHSGLRDGLDDLRGHLNDDKLWEKMKLPVEPEGRIQGMIDNLSGLLDDLGAEDRSERLRAIAEDNYDWRAIAEKLVDAARKMIA